MFSFFYGPIYSDSDRNMCEVVIQQVLWRGVLSFNHHRYIFPIAQNSCLIQLFNGFTPRTCVADTCVCVCVIERDKEKLIKHTCSKQLASVCCRCYVCKYIAQQAFVTMDSHFQIINSCYSFFPYGLLFSCN